MNPVLASESLSFRAYGTWALAECARLAILCTLLDEAGPVG